MRKTCLQSGIAFEGDKLAKHHPRIATLLQEAYRDGWYSAAIDAMRQVRRQKDTLSVECFIDDVRRLCQCFGAKNPSVARAIEQSCIPPRVRIQQLKSWLTAKGWRWSHERSLYVRHCGCIAANERDAVILSAKFVPWGEIEPWLETLDLVKA